MKKMFKVFALALLIIFAFTACPDNGGGGHTHNWSVWATTTSANCTAAGLQTRTCSESDCPTPTQTQPIAILGHNWNWGSYSSGTGARSCQRGGCSVTAGIGDTGQGGGVIFYASSFTFYQTAIDTTGVTRYYLEAAPRNIAGTHMWAASNGLIPGLSQDNTEETDWAIGRGLKNTLIINAETYSTPAANATRTGSHGNGTRTDWFLPSRHELNELYIRRAVVNTSSVVLGGSVLETGMGIFWSSSQNHSLSARARNFNDGDLYGTSKNDDRFNVRAVRAF